MKTRFLVLGLATLSAAFAVPALGQSRAEEDRWRSAQRRYDEERNIYEREQQRYDEAKRRDEQLRYDNNYGNNYDPARDYRADSRYAERPMTAQDPVWQGSDGQYYCRRTDGTTGLVVGAGVGALVGRGIDGGSADGVAEGGERAKGAEAAMRRGG